MLLCVVSDIWGLLGPVSTFGVHALVNTGLGNAFALSNRLIAGLGIELPVVLDLRILKVGLLLVSDSVVELIELVPRLDCFLVVHHKWERHATYGRALCCLWRVDLRTHRSVFGLVMATPNAVGNFRDSFDIDVVRHEYLVARWAATLTGNGIDSVRFKGSLVLPDYRLMSAPGDLRSKLTLN